MRRRKVVVEVAKRAGEDMGTDTEAQARAFDVTERMGSVRRYIEEARRKVIH